MRQTNTAILKNGKKIASVYKCSNPMESGVGLLQTPELKKENGYHTGIIMPIPCIRQKFSGFINSIHMIGMKYPISVFWTDDAGVVVTKYYAVPGFRVYSPTKPSVNIIELDSEAINTINVGDRLIFEEEK